MRENQWQRFFEIVDAIVSLPDISQNAKADLVRKKAGEYQSDRNFYEFASWFANDDDEPGEPDQDDDEPDPRLTR